MKRLLTVFSLCLAVVALAQAQGTRVATRYAFAAGDTVLGAGLGSIRGVAYHPDVDGDGRSEIVATSYDSTGRLVLYETIGNDSIAVKWISPKLGSTGYGNPTPRAVIFGDLDNDGRQEIITQIAGKGIVIFEWDGVKGSDNYGKTPSQVIGLPFLNSIDGYAEYMEVTDVDNDSQTELLIAINASGSANDRYYMASAIGGWDTENPGFSSFVTEYNGLRGDFAKWQISGGSPVALIAANFDGTGAKEILLHNWNLKNVVPMRVTAKDKYALSDTTAGKQNRQLGGANDDVSLFGGLAYDIDGDGREEVYLPTYPTPAAGPTSGRLHMISYNTGENTAIIDSFNVTTLSTSAITATSDQFFVGYGDINKNGKKEIYVSSGYPNNLVSVEFQGSNKRVASNWTTRLLYTGDATVYEAYAIRDSAGKIDTTFTTNKPFVSKLFGRNTDFDKDSFEDIIMPFQAVNDSIAITKRTWNTSTSKYDTVKSKIVNPKRFALRILESTGATGIDAKDATIIVPSDFRLDQNYPNPFNPSTTIRYYLPYHTAITLKIYDALGREVRTLINNEDQPAGAGNVVWDGKNNRGFSVSSGTYFYTMIYGNFQQTRKMVLVK